MIEKTISVKLEDKDYEKLEEILKELNNDEDAEEIVDFSMLISEIVQFYIKAYATVKEREQVLR